MFNIFSQHIQDQPLKHSSPSLFYEPNLNWWKAAIDEGLTFPLKILHALNAAPHFLKNIQPICHRLYKKGKIEQSGILLRSCGWSAWSRLGLNYYMSLIYTSHNFNLVAHIRSIQFWFWKTSSELLSSAIEIKNATSNLKSDRFDAVSFAWCSYN